MEPRITIALLALSASNAQLTAQTTATSAQPVRQIASSRMDGAPYVLEIRWPFTEIRTLHA
jgi:hypothetical protein